MEMSCLAIGAAAIHRSPEEHRWRWLAVSLAVGCYAFSIREYAIAAPIAVLVAAGASDRQRRRPHTPSRSSRSWSRAPPSTRTPQPARREPGSNAPTPETTLEDPGRCCVLSLALAPALLVGVMNWVPHWWRSGDRIGVIVGALIGAATATMIYADQIAIRIGGDPGDGTGPVRRERVRVAWLARREFVRRQPAVAVCATDLGPVERSCAGRDVRCLCLPRRRHRGGASVGSCAPSTSGPSRLRSGRWR